jgi:ribosomal protein L30/L7E
MQKDTNPILQFSDKTNLLEQSSYKYQLQDRESPNLYRYLYDYKSVPKVPFNHRSVPMNMPKDIWITDTTFRDGQQSTSPFSVEQIVHLYKLMHKLGGSKGLIRQSEFFIYTEKDRKAVEECMSLGYKFPEVTSWIRANEKDFDIVKGLGLKETGILVSCSDYHIYNKMGLTRKQAMDKYLGIVKNVLDKALSRDAISKT